MTELQFSKICSMLPSTRQYKVCISPGHKVIVRTFRKEARNCCTFSITKRLSDCHKSVPLQLPFLKNSQFSITQNADNISYNAPNKKVLHLYTTGCLRPQQRSGGTPRHDTNKTSFDTFISAALRASCKLYIL